MTHLTNFSVIIPVYNGSQTLVTCLNAWLNQNYPSNNYEIILVNDGSTDNTAEIAGKYPIRIINLKKNQGRITARNIGAKAARFETLIFNDVRIFPEPNMMMVANKYTHQPLMPNVEVYHGDKWGFSRFFHLLRCKLYAPYYPLTRHKNEFEVTKANFDKAPKGLGILICNKELWFAGQPETSNKFTNDDTLILQKIIQFQPIIKTALTWVKYYERTEFKRIVPHTFERGPRFADFYLGPGGRYYRLYVGIWLMITMLMLSAFFYPALTLLVSGILLLSMLIGVAVYLAQRPADLLVVGICFPVIAVMFGLGILKWQVLQILNYFYKKVAFLSPKIIL